MQQPLSKKLPWSQPKDGPKPQHICRALWPHFPSQVQPTALRCYPRPYDRLHLSRNAPVGGSKGSEDWDGIECTRTFTANKQRHEAPSTQFSAKSSSLPVLSSAHSGCGPNYQGSSGMPNAADVAASEGLSQLAYPWMAVMVMIVVVISLLAWSSRCVIHFARSECRVIIE